MSRGSRLPSVMPTTSDEKRTSRLACSPSEARRCMLRDLRMEFARRLRLLLGRIGASSSLILARRFCFCEARTVGGEKMCRSSRPHIRLRSLSLFFCLFDCLRYLSIEHLFPSIPMPSSVTAVARERSPTPAAALSAETAPAASKEEAMTKKASSSIDENVDKTNVKKQPAPEDPAGVDARVRALYYVMQSVEVSV